MRWLTLLVVLVSCTHLKPGPELSSHAKEVPEWVYAPMDGCIEEQELCASGEGATASIADANALKSLAAIFETKVQATTQSTMTASDNNVFRQAQETAAIHVKEEVSQTLEAAKVKRRHRFEKMSYSLVALDKSRAGQNLKAAIDKIQSELSALWKRQDRTAWAKMWELHQKREGLNDRYTVLFGDRLSFTPTSKELQDWYQTRKALTPMGFETDDLPTEYEGALKGRLTNAGYRLFSVKDGERVKAKFEAKQEHLKVGGFEKWFFVLTIEHLSKAGAKVGALTVQHTATGRTRADCEMKARDHMVTAAEERLSELNLED